MNPSDALDRILASLHHAALDDAHWPTTTALIEEACGYAGNLLVIGEGFGGDVRIAFFRYLRRGDLDGTWRAATSTPNRRATKRRLA